MTDTNLSTADEPLTSTGRLTHNLLNRRLGSFVSEFILIVAGILIALAIDGWVDDLKDRRAEKLYLGLLARDVREIRKQAELQIDFEKGQLEIGARAYKALGNGSEVANKSEIGALLGALSRRRTLNLTSATYDQMVSSGQLQIIRDHYLRDRLVRFFFRMDLAEKIVEKNNNYLIDETYVPFLMRTGITVHYTAGDSITKEIGRSSKILNEYLGPNFKYPEDSVLSQPMSAESWNDIRRNLIFRLIISSVAMAQAESIVVNTEEVSKAIATKLTNNEDS